MKKACFLALLFVSTLCMGQQESSKAVLFGASYTGDFVSNISGGIKKGTGYLGYATLNIGIDFEKAGWWKGGEWMAEAACTHGSTPSAEWIGDLQTIDNIEAGNHLYLQQFLYKQTLGNFHFSIGLQDLNADYAICESAGDYINSSFGIPSVFATSIQVPIFPLTGLGLNLSWNISKQWIFQAAIYNGNMIDFDENPYNLRWTLDKRLLYITETHFFSKLSEPLHFCYKAGVYYHSGEKKHGCFLSADQDLWKNGEKRLNCFLQTAYTSKQDKGNYAHFGAGINFYGLLSKESADKIGLAVSTAFIRNDLNESTIELTYKYAFKYFFLQPDFQYVIHPAGHDISLSNALVGLLRFGAEF